MYNPTLNIDERTAQQKENDERRHRWELSLIPEQAQTKEIPITEQLQNYENYLQQNDFAKTGIAKLDFLKNRTEDLQNEIGKIDTSQIENKIKFLFEKAKKVNGDEFSILVGKSQLAEKELADLNYRKKFLVELRTKTEEEYSALKKHLQSRTTKAKIENINAVINQLEGEIKNYFWDSLQFEKKANKLFEKVKDLHLSFRKGIDELKIFEPNEIEPISNLIERFVKMEKNPNFLTSYFDGRVIYKNEIKDFELKKLPAEFK